MTLGSTQSPTEISTRNIYLRGGGGRAPGGWGGEPKHSPPPRKEQGRRDINAPVALQFVTRNILNPF